MKTRFFLSFVMIIFSLNFVSAQVNNTQKSNSKIQVALLLDVSNSMDGLIDQAKTQLWNVVNDLATAQYAGFRPTLEIALYEYGNDGLPASEGFVKQVSQLTTDLDKISEDLFGLKTNGGSEYCGYVIDKAVNQLNWSKSDKDLKIIFIAGNEEFTQGNVLYSNSCKSAITKGIVINTIFCGPKDEGIRTMWKDGADLADGKYLNIDQNQTVAYIDSPFDDEILKMNNELNSTYISYGSSGKKMKQRQESQDKNAEYQSKGASVNRSVSKSSTAYTNSNWDLVDASEGDSKILSKVENEDLPDEMKKMNEKEKSEYLVKKKEERTKIQSKISDLNKKREAYVKEKQKENSQTSTLGDAMIDAVHKQAIKKKFTFSK